MPCLGSSPSEYINPRWHLLNLLPLWIVQALTSIIIGFLPFFCIMGMGCGPQNTPGHKAAIGANIITLATIAGEAYFFARRTLRPFKSLIFQILKILAVSGQWMAFRVVGHIGPEPNLRQWTMYLAAALLNTAFTLPFSVHLLYVTLDYLRSDGPGPWRNLRDLRNGNEIASDDYADGEHASLEELEEPMERYCENERRWPPRGKLWPNWILQLVFPPFLGFIRFARLEDGRTNILSHSLTIIVVAFFLCPILYEVYFSFKEDGKRLSLRDYLHLQIFKVVLMYLMFNLVVSAFGGWQLDIGSWVRSLFGVFILSILFGTPFTAEFVFAAVEYMECQQKASQAYRKIEDQEGDPNACDSTSL